MRVLQACPYAWDAPGGVQTQVRQLARQLEAAGHDVLVIAPARSAASEPGVRVVGRPVRVAYNGSVAPICFSPGSVAAVRDALATFAPDVVHAHEPFAPSTAMFATLAARVPVVATFHACLAGSRLPAALAPLLRRVWRRVDVTLAVSEAAAAFARRTFGGRIDIVPNGIDLGPFAGARPAPLPAGRTLLFVGRLEPRKGFPHALEAFRLLSARYADLRLVVAGDGPGRRALEALAPALRDRVLMLGCRDDGVLASCYAAADVFIAPATGHESFGVVLVEAMASGLPVVASDIAGFREVVRAGRDGLLVPPGRPAALADAVSLVLEDRGLAARLVESGRERAASFSWERQVRRIEAHYAAAIEAARARAEAAVTEVAKA